MPRFGVEPEFSPAETRVPTTSRERKLSCLSPDGRTVLSFDAASNTIVAHNLPLSGTAEEEVDREAPAIVETELPGTVGTCLRVDPAVELLSVESDTVPTSEDSRQCLLPLICLYSRKAVFVLRLAYPSNFSSTAAAVKGQVVSVSEPFESALLSPSTSLSIVRVRAAPQRQMGYPTMCPAGSMAVLAHDASLNEYSLVLHHVSSVGSSLQTTPVRFSTEDLAEESGITDFSFAQSNALHLLPAMMVHLLKGSGEILAASPILFDGTVLSLAVLQESLEFLQDLVENDPSQETKYRQASAALYYLRKAFPVSSSNDDFVTATVGRGGTENATKWPVQLQGPIISAPIMEPDEVLNHAVAIEPFFSRDLVGIAIARQGGGVDFAVSPPCTVLPRFAFESDLDRTILDDALGEMGTLVERLVVEMDKENDSPVLNDMVTLVRDPVTNTMIHYVYGHGVFSVNTNALGIFSAKLREEDTANLFSPQKSSQKVQLSAWPSINVSSGDGSVALTGAVVSPDANLGHALIVRLSDGSMHAVNLTETRYAYEYGTVLEKSLNTETESTKSETDETLKSLEATRPLGEILEPLIERVKSGLNERMGKIVGAATSQDDIEPGTLAVVLEVKKKCERDVIMPVKELKGLSSAHMGVLKKMLKTQKAQLKALQKESTDLQEKAAATTRLMESVESNAKILADRSSKVLQASQDLRPSLTKTELEYFQLIERMDAQLKKWETKFDELRESSESLVDAADNNLLHCSVSLTQQEAKNCHKLLHAQDVSLRKSQEKVAANERTVNALLAPFAVNQGGD